VTGCGGFNTVLVLLASGLVVIGLWSTEVGLIARTVVFAGVFVLARMPRSVRVGAAEAS